MLYKLSADRPTLEQKKLGPFTFNIEIKKSQPHQAEGLAQARGSSEDYGHLPGYVGPDGDSLDFFVGDRHDGQIYSYRKQQKLNERGERDPKAPWKTTDVKFVVGHGPDEAAKFHAGMAGWTTPTLRYVKDKSFRDWAALEKHMNRHYKAAADSTLYDHPLESWLRARHEGVADWHMTKDLGREYSPNRGSLDASQLWQGLEHSSPDKDARQRFNAHYNAWEQSKSFSPAAVVSSPRRSSLWSFTEEPGARADVFEHPQGGAFIRYSFPSQRKDEVSRRIYHSGQLFHPNKAALEQLRDAVLRDPRAHADKLDAFLTSRLPPAEGVKQPKLTDALSQLTSADLLEMHGLPSKRTTTDYPKPPIAPPPSASTPSAPSTPSPRWGRRAAIGAATAASLYGLYRGGKYLYDKYTAPEDREKVANTQYLVEPGFLRGFSDALVRPENVPKTLRAFADAEVWGPKGPVWRPRVRYHVGGLAGSVTPLVGLAMSPFLLYRGGKALYEKYKSPPEEEEIKMKTADEAGFFPGLVEGLGYALKHPGLVFREMYPTPEDRNLMGVLAGAHLPAATLAALSAYGLYRGGKHLYDKYTTPAPVAEETKLAASISARQRFGLLKTAKAAWQKRLESGAIGVKELGRLAQGASIPASGRGWVKNIRNQLSSFTTDLTPEQLVRYQKRVALTNPAYMKAHSVLPHNAPGYGPATVMSFMGPQVYTSPNAGTQIRGMVHSNPAVKTTAATVLASGKELPPWVQKRIARASDPVVTKGIVDHELAERRMLVGGALNKYPTTGFASHAGPDALIAERLGIRDPEAQQLFDKLRQLSPDDAAATALLKQHGMTPNSAIPLGGRAHRSLLGAVEHMPTGAGALRLRAATSTPVYGETREKLEKYRRYAQTAERLLPQASPAVRPVQALRDNIEGILAAPDRAQQLSPDQIKYMLSRMSST